jgi:hypothetical protein
MIVGVLTTCHTQYTWDRSICVCLFNRTTLHVFVTYLTGALYVHPLWFYKHQHDNRVRSTQNAISLPFAAILVNCAPSGEMHNYCTPHIINENLLIHRCNTYSYLKCIVYDKLLKHRQSFWITLYTACGQHWPEGSSVACFGCRILVQTDILVGRLTENCRVYYLPSKIWSCLSAFFFVDLSWVVLWCSKFDNAACTRM